MNHQQCYDQNKLIKSTGRVSSSYISKVILLPLPGIKTYEVIVSDLLINYVSVGSSSVGNGQDILTP